MRVLVTGGTGFLGQAVFNSMPRHEVHAWGSRDANLLDPKETIAKLYNVMPDAVIHLAANVGGIGKNQRMPGTLAYDNLMMGLNVIEACRIARVRKLVLVGTICSYPKFTKVPFREEDLWNGKPEETNAPYGIAKKAVMVIGQAYRKQYGMNVVNLLLVNLYGPGDNFDLEDSHVLPAMIRKFHEAKPDLPVKLWGDGSPSREFLFVEDAAEAISRALDNYDGDDPVNIGSGKEITIRNLAEKIQRVVGHKGEILWDHGKPNGQPRRCLDVSRAWERFGWRASTEFDSGLAETYRWWIDKGTKK